MTDKKLINDEGIQEILTNLNDPENIPDMSKVFEITIKFQELIGENNCSNMEVSMILVQLKELHLAKMVQNMFKR